MAGMLTDHQAQDCLGRGHGIIRGLHPHRTPRANRPPVALVFPRVAAVQATEDNRICPLRLCHTTLAQGEQKRVLSYSLFPLGSLSSLTFNCVLLQIALRALLRALLSAVCHESVDVVYREVILVAFTHQLNVGLFVGVVHHGQVDLPFHALGQAGFEKHVKLC